MIRDHQETVLEEFNGLWIRGDADSVPIDHFIDSENVQHFESGFETRDGLDTLIAKGNVLRIYNYIMQTGESLLLLDTDGNIWHALLDGSNTVYGPILSISGMTDFGFQGWAGRAYITPFTTFVDDNGYNYQKGLEDEFLYVYRGDGTAARLAGGDPPENDEDDIPLIAFNSTIDGVVGKGIHVIGFTYSDGVNDSIGIGPTIRAVLYAPGDKQVIVNNIHVTAEPGVTERKMWMTRSIDPEDWDPDTSSYIFYLVKTIPSNVDVSTILNIADVDLITAFVPGVLPNPTSGGITAANSETDGYCDLGLHVIGVVYETDTGYLTAPGPEFFAVQSFVNLNKAIDVAGIPVSPNGFIIRRHLVATKAINNFNGNNLAGQFAYQFFFIPDGTIEDNVTTELTVSFYDADLLEDASYLIDNFAQIPAGVGLGTYNGRMALWASFDDISVVRFSSPGEPEAFDQVDGFSIVPLDGNPLTNGSEFRDIFYSFKKTRTYAIADNGDLPSTWAVIPIDLGIGASVHGVATVLDSGGVNIDYLIIVDWSGIMVFNGMYARPELTWKIADFWLALDRNDFGNIQILNDSLKQIIYMTLPDKKMLVGFYDDGLNAKDIKWAKWRFDIETTTITLINTNTVVIGAEQAI